MSFTVNLDPSRRRAPSKAASANGNNAIGVIVGAIVLFCVWDMSPYGYGYVPVAVGEVQRAIQLFFANNFRVRF